MNWQDIIVILFAVFAICLAISYMGVVRKWRCVLFHWRDLTQSGTCQDDPNLTEIKCSRCGNWWIEKRGRFFKQKNQDACKDAFGHQLIPNENGHGSRVSDAGVAAWEAWMKANPPPQDGHAYISDALHGGWQRYYGPLKQPTENP